MFEYGWYLLCRAASGGGGNSKLGRFDAADLRAVKLAVPPKESDVRCMMMCSCGFLVLDVIRAERES